MSASANVSAEPGGMFVSDLPGRDPLHYGDGEIINSVQKGITYITLQGPVMPGLDYKFYLMSTYTDTKAGVRLSRPKAACKRYKGV